MPKEEHRMDSITDGVIYRVKCHECDEDFLINDKATMYPADFLATMEVNVHTEECDHTAYWGVVE